MKWISIIAILCLTVWACNNNTHEEKNTTNDSLDNIDSDRTMNTGSNLGTRMGDTSSYERMAQKITDSVPQ
ncbi:MAG: hypothetical protein ABI480_05880 [Chitinophagaceae bacterium]